MRKSAALVFITVLTLYSLFMVGSVFAQPIPKPSVPEFTINQVDRSYDVPVTITYSTNPFTGEKVENRTGGYRVQNKTIDITIKNQPFTPIDLGNGSIIQLYYSVRAKGHFGDWSDASSAIGYVFKRVLASTADYTVVTLILTSQFWQIPGSAQPDLNIPEGGQEDFQVKAQAGYEYLYSDGHIFPIGTEFETIKESSWSNTQTITIGEGQLPTPAPATTPTPAPTATPSPIPVPGQSYFFVESNSSVSELFFNSTSAELSFTVSGEKGTAGYVEVTIAKSLVSSVQDIKAYLDGNELSVEVTSDEDAWLLSFNYMHSTHSVKVSLAANGDPLTFIGIEYWIWISVAVITAVIGAGLLFFFRKRKHEAERRLVKKS